jgi:hypothetical protein
LNNEILKESTRSRLFFGAVKTELDELLANQLSRFETSMKSSGAEKTTTLLKLTGTIHALRKLKNVGDKDHVLLNRTCSRTPSIKFSPIQQAARTAIAIPPPLNLGQIEKNKQTYQSSLGRSSLGRSSSTSSHLTSPINKARRRERTTSVFYPLPTPTIVKRLSAKHNFTGIQRRHAFQEDRRNSSCTLSHQDLRSERTARGAFQNSLRSEFYHLAEQ